MAALIGIAPSDVVPTVQTMGVVRFGKSEIHHAHCPQGPSSLSPLIQVIELHGLYQSMCRNSGMTQRYHRVLRQFAQRLSKSERRHLPVVTARESIRFFAGAALSS